VTPPAATVSLAIPIQRSVFAVQAITVFGFVSSHLTVCPAETPPEPTVTENREPLADASV